MKQKRSVEDYLRFIHQLGDKVKSSDLACKLKISKASVSEMLRKLHSKDLVNIKPYSKIVLTAKGKKLAENIYSNHKTIKKFMTKLFNYSDKESEKEAHELEHSFSQQSINKLNEILSGKVQIRALPHYIG